MLGPVASYTADRSEAAAISSSTDLHINRIAVVPKAHTPGKWRLIKDMPFPEGESVNYGIDPAHCILQYTSVERIATEAQSLGAGTLLAKLAVRSAYRVISVHPLDSSLLAVA